MAFTTAQERTGGREIIANVELPLPAARVSALYTVSRARDLDIATFARASY